MFGFAFGTLCFIGLAGLLAAPRCHMGHHGHHRFHGRHGFHGGHGGHGWRGHHGGHGEGGFQSERRRGRGRHGFSRAASEIFKRHLDLDEDQADLVDHALADLRKAVHEFGDTLKAGRADLGAAFAGEQVDDAALAALFSTQDEEVARFRREAVSALKQIHAVLDPDQREEATRWLSREGGWA
ncbi:MAG: Spy/CpxP family protein refolding chaperone [Alphaproteobacteria bacterium]|nr:Spy/CpxP family protein refolding chaperone [Alphaproteobacteria bacterium]